ncbi:MAG: hypothetical protein NC212_08700 [Staphylococcus sp.]|nr:hypothetical protein [Staphylococcus sp.]
MTKTTDTPRIMTSRAVLARELGELSVGDVLHVPFKYCTANNVKVTVAGLRKEGLDFKYDNSGAEYSVITRIA